MELSQDFYSIFWPIWIAVALVSIVAAISASVIEDDLRRWIGTVSDLPSREQCRRRAQQDFQIELRNSIAAVGFSLLFAPFVAVWIWEGGQSPIVAIGIPSVVVALFTAYRVKRVRYDWRVWKMPD